MVFLGVIFDIRGPPANVLAHNEACFHQWPSGVFETSGLTCSILKLVPQEPGA